MTREEVREMLPILQAFADGKEVQYRSANGEWKNVKCEGEIYPVTTAEYRIAPEKKRVPLQFGDIKNRPTTIRRSNADYLVVISTSLDSVKMYGLQRDKVDYVDYFSLYRDDYQYTYDGETWFPCWKEVEE